LPGVAFLILWGAAQIGPRVWACFVAACLSVQLVHLDCFESRKWTGLKFQPSLWEQSFRDKPAFKGGPNEAAASLALTGRHVIIANVWPWDFDWQLEHGSGLGASGLEEEKRGPVRFYRVGPGLLTSRAILDGPSGLEGYVRDGYDVWIDRDLYREMFMRYDLSAPTPGTALIGGVECRVVGMKP